MPARSYNDDFSSDESDASSMSDMSEESIQISNTKKPFIANTKKQVASPSPAPAPAPSKPVAAKIPMPVREYVNMLMCRSYVFIYHVWKAISMLLVD